MPTATKPSSRAFSLMILVKDTIFPLWTRAKDYPAGKNGRKPFTPFPGSLIRSLPFPAEGRGKGKSILPFEFLNGLDRLSPHFETVP